MPGRRRGEFLVARRSPVQSAVAVDNQSQTTPDMHRVISIILCASAPLEPRPITNAYSVLNSESEMPLFTRISVAVRTISMPPLWLSVCGKSTPPSGV